MHEGKVAGHDVVKPTAAMSGMKSCNYELGGVEMFRTYQDHFHRDLLSVHADEMWIEGFID